MYLPMYYVYGRQGTERGYLQLGNQKPLEPLLYARAQWSSFARLPACASDYRLALVHYNSSTILLIT